MLNNSTYVKQKLVRFNSEAEERDAERRAVRQKKQHLNLVTTSIEIDALSLIPEERAKELEMAAVNLINQDLIVAAFDFNKEGVEGELKKLEERGFKIRPVIVSKSSLRHAFSFYRFVSKKQEEITGRILISGEKIKKFEKDLKTIQIIKKEVEAINFNKVTVSDFLEFVFGGALSSEASDIHFEPVREGGILRYRIDGVLNEITKQVEKNFYKKAVSRIKLLAGLKMNVIDKTQDGRFTISLENKDVEVRVAIAPSEFGEVAVLRVLDPKAISLGLAELGFFESDLKIIKEELKRPNGMILNTGPTGSGKTTTLYAFLKEKVTKEIKVITIEDPIEYHLEGIEQTQVNEEVNYTFNEGLKSALRQDPDVILVGEIRDEDTAKTAVDSALTGHLVFSTLHTNDSAGAIPRLIDLGVKENIIGSALNLVIAQRLVRRICSSCKIAEKASLEFEEKVKKFLEKLTERVEKENFLKDLKMYKIKEGGCEKCNGTGYKGRVGLYELFQVNNEVKEAIEKKNSVLEIKEIAKKQGIITMQEDGILKVITGITSIEEVEAATGVVEEFT
ncbi:MAG: GspE/PulE family protein [Candidatus Pacebacteria bacterium]|nr:GspE/PulE family protein [Candidatus Paceibacterota bacterium]